MAYDLLLKNGSVVDGSGYACVSRGCGRAKLQEITKIDDFDDSATRVIDVDWPGDCAGICGQPLPL